MECQWFGDCGAPWEVVQVLESRCRQDSWSQIESLVSLYTCALYRTVLKMFSSQHCSRESLRWNRVPWGVHAKTLDPIKKQYLGVWSSAAGEGSALECASPAFASAYFEEQ